MSCINKFFLGQFDLFSSASSLPWLSSSAGFSSSSLESEEKPAQTAVTVYMQSGRKLPVKTRSPVDSESSLDGLAGFPSYPELEYFDPNYSSENVMKESSKRKTFERCGWDQEMADSSSSSIQSGRKTPSKISSIDSIVVTGVVLW